MDTKQSRSNRYFAFKILKDERGIGSDMNKLARCLADRFSI